MINEKALYPENEYFENPGLANEVVKAVFPLKRTTRPLIQDHVERAYELAEQKPTGEDVDRTIDRCLELGVFKESGDYILPAERVNLYKSLRHLLESHVHVYEVQLDIKTAASLVKEISHEELPAGYYCANYGYKDGKLWIRTIHELPSSVLEKIKPDSEKLMTDEQFFEWAFGMYPLLNTAMLGTGIIKP